LEPIPLELFQKCYQVVRTTHGHKSVGDLPARITAAGKNYMTALAMIPDAFQMMSCIYSCFRARLLTWITGAALMVGAILLTKWMLLTLPLVGLVVWRLKSSEKDFWMFQASVLLALDMLANDFAGWGSAFPAARSQGLEILGGPLSSDWLNHYLLRRPTVDLEKIRRAMAPKAGSDPSLNLAVGESATAIYQERHRMAT
jgi:hypothetical protein